METKVPSDQELAKLSVPQLEDLLNQLDRERLDIRAAGQRIQKVRADKLATEELLAKLGQLKPAELEKFQKLVSSPEGKKQIEKMVQDNKERQVQRVQVNTVTIDAKAVQQGKAAK